MSVTMKIRLTLLILLFVSFSSYAGNVNVCKNANGTTTFTDGACPEGDQKIESKYFQESRSSVRQRSVIQQLEYLKSLHYKRT
ncbi:MAG: DUF4124 domain-containing protein [gamma proteobacterium endosymbiont of Lamellibrachia anaximandri]|nr:DUF4124 domain-containing protein [gamma proteobacterium endosymbiont of Lamellibrachia anaximandri]MBL3617043.1 DUF4124 domain-containing protein [gamma proteobacterium endosymbiont of Lamellibrachia anaximandri]